MAAALYDKGREGFLDGSIDWDTDDIRVMLVKTGYSFSAAHDFLDDVSASYDNGRSAALASKTVTGGVAGAANTSLVATAAVSSIALVLYKYNASDASARLICYIDNATGLPFTPAASQTVNITWDTGALKIFKL
jgi:hypothetical protein